MADRSYALSWESLCEEIMSFQANSNKSHIALRSSFRNLLRAASFV